MYTKHRYNKFSLGLKGFKFSEEHEKAIIYIKKVIDIGLDKYPIIYFFHYIWYKEEGYAHIHIYSESLNGSSTPFEVYEGNLEWRGKELIDKYKIKIKGLKMDRMMQNDR